MSMITILHVLYHIISQFWLDCSTIHSMNISNTMSISIISSLGVHPPILIYILLLVIYFLVT